MPAGGTDHRLGKLIGEELAALRDFVAVLQKEQQTLIDGDLDRLMLQVEDKTKLSTLLTRLAEQRNQLLSAASLSNDRAGMESWLARQTSAAGNARSDGDKLLVLAAEARALNESNGKLIATRLQNTQQALGILLSASDQAALYGPDGQTQTSGSGRLFGEA